jgi:Integrase core domain
MGYLPEAYDRWKYGRGSIRSLAKSYHVDHKVMERVIKRGKLGDFSVHDSTNHRYRSIEYGLKRLTKTEQLLAKKRVIVRYEKSSPGELLHGDTKRLGRIRGIKNMPEEVLFVAIDDYSRWLFADILPDKTMWSSSMFLETTLPRLPFLVETHYSDNGSEYKGNPDHAFRAACVRNRIQQKFTKPKHPWTNGKAERVIRTLMEEWRYKHTFTSPDERRESLYRFVDYYNHERPHMSLHGLTPYQRLLAFGSSGDNA